MAEWTRMDLGYTDRYNHLIASSGGLNGSYLLNASTVQKDSAAIDSLFGEADRDWFLASIEDLLPDRVTSGDGAEELTLI